MNELIRGSLSEVGVVIRSCGERTEKICIDIMASQVGIDSVRIVRNVNPFYNALIESYKQAIVLGKKYTIVIDADVIPRHNAVSLFLSQFLSTDNQGVFCVMPLMLDHYFVSERVGGLHFYITACIEEILQVANVDELAKQKRPETYLKNHMTSMGYKILYVNKILGLHEFFCTKYELINKNTLKVIKFRSVLYRNLYKRKVFALISANQRFVNRIYLLKVAENRICDDKKEEVIHMAHQLGVIEQELYKCANVHTLSLLRYRPIYFIYMLFFIVLYKLINKIIPVRTLFPTSVVAKKQ